MFNRTQKYFSCRRWIYHYYYLFTYWFLVEKAAAKKSTSGQYMWGTSNWKKDPQLCLKVGNSTVGSPQALVTSVVCHKSSHGFTLSDGFLVQAGDCVVDVNVKTHAAGVSDRRLAVLLVNTLERKSRPASAISSHRPHDVTVKRVSVPTKNE